VRISQPGRACLASLQFTAVLAALAACGRTDLLRPPDDAAALRDGDIGPPTDGPSGCTTSADCVASPTGPVCDRTPRRCVVCTPTEDRCPAGLRCDGATNTCVRGCTTDRDCSPTTHCDPSRHLCVGCTTDANCAPATVCRSGTCVPGCNAMHGCGAGGTCCGEQCADTDTDANNCGMCGRACGAGRLCCAGACVDPATDPAHCGSCTGVCSVTHGRPSCVARACGVAACDMGFADCDRIAMNGCETETATSAANCGMCGRRCVAPVGGTASCTGGACTLNCGPGRADCDGIAMNGCEAFTDTDVNNCGMCRRACPSGPNATATCTVGVCGVRCNAGFADCDGIAMNGCETDTRTSALNCGMCGRACVFPHGVPGCVASTCALAGCAPGFGNCDGSAMNGCETDVQSNVANCGMCGHTCGASEPCAGGMCVPICPPPTRQCGMSCVDTTVDVNNCGACGTVCPTGAHAVSLCAASACRLACLRPFGDCDGSGATGCETDLSTDLGNCGLCGRACAFPNAGASCVSGGCALGACTPGFDNCDGNPATGCEINLGTSVANCGMCGNACAVNNGTPACAGGACGIAACNAGFGDCDTIVATGCETNTNTSPLNCGMCGHACMPGEACSRGACVTSCLPTERFCSGACVDTNTDPANCGGCGVVCTGGTRCIAGACGSPGPVNDEPAGAIAIDMTRSSQDLRASNVGAHTTIAAAPCAGGAFANDVFYRLVLTRRELVYADTFNGGMAVFDTILFFARDVGGTAVPITGSLTPGDTTCNDDAGSVGCGSEGFASGIFTVLDPGTYYIVLGGFGAGSTGVTPLHVEHMPVAAGALRALPPGASTQTGTTTGASTVGTNCGLGAGPEQTFWWRSCPGTGSGAFHADTCGGASFDTVLQVTSGGGSGDRCDDDGCAGMGPDARNSRLDTTIAATARLHTLQIDGFGATDSGSYTLHVTRP
jgi:hypothetical protein